jgi:DNA mismatch endonuclease (patch repair protein)
MDRVTKETRSKVMSTIRSKNTRLEEALVSILNSAGIKEFTRYAQGLPGTPDIAFTQEKVAIFLDSCFWHGCPKHLRRPSSNTVYWEAKIEKNIKRDRHQRTALRRLGWSVIRVWEHELKKPEGIVKKICQILQRRS